MSRPFEFSIDEWYHCFSRGVEKRTTFEDKTDYDRFLSLIYLANSDMAITLFNQRGAHSLSDALDMQRGSPLVEVSAYCLMPNHYHLIVKEIIEGGISKFMQKLGTGYTMYFNTRYERTGNLFVGPFRARHINNDDYLQRAIEYVHFNPAELIEPGWKKGQVRNVKKLKEELTAYPYSSLKDYQKRSLPTRRLIGSDIFEIYRTVPIGTMLRNAREYYAEIGEQY